ncbi:hypothetical protein EZY14_002610 [Kordia sp. TARA_039_SRF]|nr:hypothetical protein EZY14_002610 [Kordia sp. TARA_039_SRF]
MPTLTPSAPIAFNYLQTFNTPVISCTYDVSDLPFSGNIQNLELYGFPAWLMYQNAYVDHAEKKIFFTLKVIETYAYTLSEGDYYGEFIVKFRGAVGFSLTTFTSNPFAVTLNVQHATQLNIIPNQFIFNYIIGGNAPATQTLQIQSSSNWTVESNQSWVTISNASGVDSGQVSIGADASGITTGTYSAIITVTDAYAVQQAVVTLNVSDAQTSSTYLYVSPQNLEFLSILAVDNTTVKTLNIEASHSWSASSSQSWLVISATSGSAGETTIDVSVDSVALTETQTSYLGIITFTSQNIQQEVFVVLNILEFFLQGLASDSFYYIDDRNKFEASNIIPNNYLLIQSITSYNGKSYILKTRTPYHLGVATALIGMEGNTIMPSMIPTTDFTTRIKNDFLPMVVNYNIRNKNAITDAVTNLANYNNVRFIQGKTPAINDKLTYTPAEVTLTKKGVLSLSVKSDVAVTTITVSGDFTATYTTSIGNELYVYNAIIDLAPMNLVPGNQITINFGGFDTIVNISESSQEQNLLFFETEWQTYDVFETTGALSIANDVTREETVIDTEGKEHTKIVSINLGAKYTLDTGWVYSQDEVEWLMKLLTAKRFFLYHNNIQTEIVLETRQLTVYKTREYAKSYQLKFKKAIV